MRQIPPSVTVSGKAWKVLIVSRKALKGDHGLCDTTRRRIKLASDLSPDDRWQYFVHELIHAAFHEAYENSNISVDLGDFEEPITRMLEIGLYPALRDNGLGG